MSTPISPGPSPDSGAAYPPAAGMPPKPEKASLVEDFIDIFYTPSSVFSRRAMSSFWMPLLIVSVVAAGFAFANRGLNAHLFDLEYSRSAASMMEKNPQLTADMMATQRNMSEKFAGFAGYIGTPLALFFVGFFVWLVAKLVKAKISYEQAVLIVTFAWVPRLVEMLLVTVQALLLDTTTIANRFDVSFSVARFFDYDKVSPAIMMLLGRLDVFTIWTTILIAIGVAVIGKVERTKGYIAAGLVYVLGTIFMVVTAR